VLNCLFYDYRSIPVRYDYVERVLQPVTVFFLTLIHTFVVYVLHVHTLISHFAQLPAFVFVEHVRGGRLPLISPFPGVSLDPERGDTFRSLIRLISIIVDTFTYLIATVPTTLPLPFVWCSICCSFVHAFTHSLRFGPFRFGWFLFQLLHVDFRSGFTIPFLLVSWFCCTVYFTRIPSFGRSICVHVVTLILHAGPSFTTHSWFYSFIHFVLNHFTFAILRLCNHVNTICLRCSSRCSFGIFPHDTVIWLPNVYIARYDDFVVRFGGPDHSVRCWRLRLPFSAFTDEFVALRLLFHIWAGPLFPTICSRFPHSCRRYRSPFVHSTERSHIHPFTISTPHSVIRCPDWLRWPRCLLFPVLFLLTTFIRWRCCSRYLLLYIAFQRHSRWTTFRCSLPVTFDTAIPHQTTNFVGVLPCCIRLLRLFRTIHSCYSLVFGRFCYVAIDLPISTLGPIRFSLRNFRYRFWSFPTTDFCCCCSILRLIIHLIYVTGLFGICPHSVWFAVLLTTPDFTLRCVRSRCSAVLFHTPRCPNFLRLSFPHFHWVTFHSWHFACWHFIRCLVVLRSSRCVTLFWTCRRLVLQKISFPDCCSPTFLAVLLVIHLRTIPTRLDHSTNLRNSTYIVGLVTFISVCWCALPFVRPLFVVLRATSPTGLSFYSPCCVRSGIPTEHCSIHLVLTPISLFTFLLLTLQRPLRSDPVRCSTIVIFGVFIRCIEKFDHSVQFILVLFAIVAGNFGDDTLTTTYVCWIHRATRTVTDTLTVPTLLLPTTTPFTTCSAGGGGPTHLFVVHFTFVHWWVAFHTFHHRRCWTLLANVHTVHSDCCSLLFQNCSIRLSGYVLFFYVPILVRFRSWTRSGVGAFSLFTFVFRLTLSRFRRAGVHYIHCRRCCSDHSYVRRSFLLHTRCST